MTSLIEQFFRSTPIAGGNADYVEALYEHWLADPDSVDAAWQTYFAELKGREAGDIPRSVILDRIAEAAKHAGRVNGDGPVDDEQARGHGSL